MSQTKRNKTNGRNSQKMACRFIKKVFPTFEIIPSNQDIPFVSDKPLIQSKCMGQGDEDVPMNAHARAILDLSLEVKHSQGHKLILNYVDQANKNCKGHTPCVVLHPKNSRRLLAIVDFEYLLKLIRKHAN